MLCKPALEPLIDDVTARYEPPQEFVLPVEPRVAAALDVARTVVRRAEREAVTATHAGWLEPDSQVVPYLNRLADLVYTLAHNDTGRSVVVIDRPGVPTSGAGCSSNHINATLDDEAALPVESQCGLSTNPTPPPYAIDGAFTPNNPLSAFDGEALTGTWTLTVSDNAGVDVGTLTSFSLTIDAVNDGGGVCSAATSLRLLSPNGGEVLPTGSLHPIQWEAPAGTEPFGLSYIVIHGADQGVVEKFVLFVRRQRPETRRLLAVLHLERDPAAEVAAEQVRRLVQLPRHGADVVQRLADGRLVRVPAFRAATGEAHSAGLRQPWLVSGSLLRARGVATFGRLVGENSSP